MNPAGIAAVCSVTSLPNRAFIFFII